MMQRNEKNRVSFVFFLTDKRLHMTTNTTLLRLTINNTSQMTSNTTLLQMTRNTTSQITNTTSQITSNNTTNDSRYLLALNIFPPNQPPSLPTYVSVELTSSQKEPLEPSTLSLHLASSEPPSIPLYLSPSSPPSLPPSSPPFSPPFSPPSSPPFSPPFSPPYSPSSPPSSPPHLPFIPPPSLSPQVLTNCLKTC